MLASDLLPFGVLAPVLEDVFPPASPWMADCVCDATFWAPFGWTRYWEELEMSEAATDY